MLFASHLCKFFFEADHVLNGGYLKDCRVLYWYRTAPPLANVCRFRFVELFSAHLPKGYAPANSGTRCRGEGGQMVALTEFFLGLKTSTR